MTSLGDGWYQCWLVIDVDSTTGQVKLNVAEADTDVTFDGLSQESILLYQPQLERAKPNQTAPGTYTATTTAAVTNYSPSTYIATTTVAVSSLSGANDGLVDWESRTNICVRSEEFDNASWVSIGGLVVNANLTIAPDGSLTADQFIDPDTASTGSIYRRQAFTVSTSTRYTFSIFAKADQLSWLHLFTSTFTTPADGSGRYFDLASCALGTDTGGMDDAGIEDYGNGWCRCWISFTTDAADTIGFVNILVADADNDTTVDFDGTSSIFVWGAQMEVGSEPSPYIRTTTGTVTANADALAETTLTWFDGSKGTLFIETDTPYGDSVDDFGLLSINDGTASNEYTLRVGNDDGAFNIVGGANAGSIAFVTNDYRTAGIHRLVGAYAQDDMVLYLDGTAGTPDTLVDVPLAGLTQLQVGIRPSTPQINGLIREIRYYDERLADSVVQDMSNGNFPAEGHSGIGLGFGKMGAQGAQ
jgi:hypothetical protein